MRSKLKYELPVREDDILEIIREGSPAHKLFKVYDEELKREKTYDHRRAIDFLCEPGTPVLAAASGEVIKAFSEVSKTWSKYEPPPKDFLEGVERFGNHVVIKHGHAEYSIYAHLSKVKVKEGKRVKTGQVIGLSGETGWSIKPHVHFAVFKFLDKNTDEVITLEPRWASKEIIKRISD